MENDIIYFSDFPNLQETGTRKDNGKFDLTLLPTQVDNTIIIQKLSKVLFEEINSFMVGWFNEAQVELSFVSYMKIMWPMLQSYFGKE